MFNPTWKCQILEAVADQHGLALDSLDLRVEAQTGEITVLYDGEPVRMNLYFNTLPDRRRDVGAPPAAAAR